MKQRMNFLPSFLLLILLLCSGCATKGWVREHLALNVSPELEETRSQLQARLSQIETEQGVLQKKLTALEEEVAKMSERVNFLHQQVNAAERHVTSFQETLTQTLAEMTPLKEELDARLQELTTKLEELRGFADRIEVLRTNVASLQKDLTSGMEELGTKVSRHEVAMRDFNKAVDTQRVELEKQISGTEKLLADRLSITKEDLRVLRKQMDDNVKTLKRALEDLGDAMVAVIKMQRRQFEELVETVDENLIRLEPHLPKETLQQLEKATDAQPTPKKED